MQLLYESAAYIIVCLQTIMAQDQNYAAESVASFKTNETDKNHAQVYWRCAAPFVCECVRRRYGNLLDSFQLHWIEQIANRIEKPKIDQSAIQRKNLIEWLYSKPIIPNWIAIVGTKAPIVGTGVRPIMSY